MSAVRATVARALLLLAFFASGAAGLAYEVAWTRGLLRFLGSTAAASTLVLAVFVGGLGLGARWGGGAAGRSARPLRLYGVLEVLAALWALLSFGLAGSLEGLYVGVARDAGPLVQGLLRALVAVGVVGPGAFLLGATLPALVRHWVRSPGAAGRGTAVLYGVNTVGAVAGTLATGFWAIERFGVQGTLAGAALLAGLVGVLALAAGLRAAPLPREAPAGDPGPAAPTRPGALRQAALAAFLGGFVGLGVEIAGFRILTFFLEGFTVTFAAMLATFVAGLGLGSLVLGPRLAGSERPLVPLGALFLVEAVLLVALGVFVLPDLEGLLRGIKAWAYAGVTDPAGIVRGLQVFALAGAATLLFLPAFVWGATFPLAVRAAERAGDPPARAVGRVYLWNSLGSVAAPLAVTFLLVPWRGPLGALGPLALLAIGAGGLFLLRGAGTRPLSAGWRLGLPVLLLPLVLAVLLPWGRTEAFLETTHVLRGKDRVLKAVASDAFTTASVVETADGERILYTDDFAAAATGRHYRYMRMLGHLPALLAKDPENALVIAFGTGTTAGAVAAHPGVKRLEIAEVSRAVLDLAPWFEEANRRVLADPRVRVHRDDGRNVLRLHAPDLDLVTLEPLMPYSPAGLPFYTRDFYALARERLREGGVVCQWIPVHAMPVAMFAALVRTFLDVFPDGTLWFFEQSVALIGRRGTAGPGIPEIERRFVACREDLRAAGLPTPATLATAYVAGGATLRGAEAPRLPWTDRPVTDLDPWPEFHPTPRAGFRTSYLEDTLGWLADLARLDPGPADLLPGGGPAAGEARIAVAIALSARAADARAEALEAVAASRPAGGPASQALVAETARAWGAAARGYTAALERVPEEGAWRWRRARAARRATRLEVIALFAVSDAKRAQGQTAEAEEMLRRAARLAGDADRLEDGDPAAAGREEAALLHVRALLHLGRCGAAREALAAARAALTDAHARARLAQVERALAEHAEGRGAARASLPALEGAAPCAPEGAEALRAEVDRLGKALEGDPRGVRAAALSLEDAARRAGAEAAAADALRAALAKATAPEARAALAGSLDDLDAASRALAPSLAPDAAVVVRAGALAEVVRRRLGPRYRGEILAGLSDAAPTIRAASADAAVAFPDRESRLALAALLLDPERSVRVAAAAALHAAAPEVLETFDPDAAEAERAKVVGALRERWR